MTHLAPLFQGYPLSLFFSPTCLVNKACMSPFIIKKQSGPFSKAAMCISPFGFQKILPKHERLLILCIKLYVFTRSAGLLTFPPCCRHRQGPQKWQIVPQNPLGLPGGKGRACKTASPGPPVSSVLFSTGHSITGSSICNKTVAAC